MGEASTWRQCNICKTPIAFSAKHYVCSVSTCNRKRTGMVFCSVPCFEAHLPMMRHRDAWAEEATSPTREQAAAEAQEGSRDTPVPQRRLVTQAAGTDGADHDVLVVASKLKKFIKSSSGMNTSDSVMPVLSRHLREVSVAALRQAATEGRKTVLDRDFEAVLHKKPD